jgi:lipoate-protein ligase A
MQMAIDRWLFEQHDQGLHPPTLRFYTWNPIAISLGYHQHQWPPDWQQLTWQNQPIDLVRRPTGGRAVLHHGDLTYAVVVSELTGSRMQSYQFICEFLIQGWRSLGVNLAYGKAGRGYIHNPNCFSLATAADLVLEDGTKLIGSAQLCRSHPRRGNTILQHGSIQLETDPNLFQHIFGVEVYRSPQSFFPHAYSQETIITALTQAAQEHFKMQFEIKPLTSEEWQEIKALQNYNLGQKV